MNLDLNDREAEEVYGALAYYARIMTHGKKETKASIRRIMARIRKKQAWENVKKDKARNHILEARLG